MHKNFTDKAWEDYLFWQATDRRIVKRIHELLKDIDRNGYFGIGKPEPLSSNHAGWWSVGIDEKNRLVFRIINDQLEISSCKTHYGDN